MTNDLSQQLCELCGIEKTVDFTKPANFVRLLNLQTSIGDTVATLISRKYYMINTNTFIQDVLWFCTENDDPEASEAIMQSIREAEWVYE